MYKFLKVEVTCSGDIIYNSRIGPSVGEVATLQGLVPNVFARLIIEKQDISLLATKQFFVVPKEDFFLFKEEIYVSTNGPIRIHALCATPHKHQSTNDIL